MALRKGDRVRFREGAFSWANKPGDLGTFEGGAEYVPGWDAGHYSVALDEPNLYGHRVANHWTQDEVESAWEKVEEDNRDDELEAVTREFGPAETWAPGQIRDWCRD